MQNPVTGTGQEDVPAQLDTAADRTRIPEALVRALDLPQLGTLLIGGVGDRIGAFPATPGDLAATLFWRFGIDPAAEIHDQTGRPHPIARGQPIRALFDG